MTLPMPFRPLVLGLVLGSSALAYQPARGQDARAAITVLGGGSMYDDLTPGMAPTVLGSGWVAGLQAETWLLGGRTGLRLNGQYEQRSPESLTPVYAVAMADADLLVRLLPVWRDRAFAPYLAIGGGATTFFSRDPSVPLGSGAYGTDPVSRVHMLVGLGVDIAPWRHAGFRLEVADRIVFPSVGESPEAEGLPVAHNPVVTAGLQLRFGSLSRRDAARPSTPRSTPAAAAPPPARAAAPDASDGANATTGTDTTVETEPTNAGAGGPPAPGRNAAPRGAAGESGTPRAAGSRGRGPATSPPGPREDRPLFTVQLGSFVETATAIRWAERLSERGLPVWLMRLEIQGEGVRRIRVGATMVESDAGRLAEALRVEFGWSTRVDRIGEGEEVPPGALGKTRAYMAGRRADVRP